MSKWFYDLSRQNGDMATFKKLNLLVFHNNVEMAIKNYYELARKYALRCSLKHLTSYI